MGEALPLSRRRVFMCLPSWLVQYGAHLKIAGSSPALHSMEHSCVKLHSQALNNLPLVKFKTGANGKQSHRRGQIKGLNVNGAGGLDSSDRPVFGHDIS